MAHKPFVFGFASPYGLEINAREWRRGRCQLYGRTYHRQAPFALLQRHSSAHKVVTNLTGFLIPTLASTRAPRFCAGEAALLHAGLASRILPSSISPISRLRQVLQYPPLRHSATRIDRCLQFGREERVHACCDEAVSWLLRALFAVARELCDARIDRFDLHHAHWWINEDANTCGLLFHAHEYPVCNEEFGYELGFCQRESTLVLASNNEMTMRNVLWVVGEDEIRLLDPTRIVGKEMHGVWTVDEGLFGHRVADVFYFGTAKPNPWGEKVYIVPYV
jgi:hypothetical protein